MRYSVIIPVFNRPQEVDELLSSLQAQTLKNFEVIIVEDGSTEDCRAVIEKYRDHLTIRYFFKENSGPGDSRNFGMAQAKGDYLLFFDSDCLIPAHYFETVENFLQQHPLDAFGGPDTAHPSFTKTQKAINYAMTSIITTGGVRGRENQLDNYQPRSFNMGISREVYAAVGGFGDIHPGEDPDLSYRIMDAGFSIGLIAGAYVYHKRRIDFKKFSKQVYKFGVVRNVLMKWHPRSWKVVYFLPALFLLGSIGLILLALLWSPLFLIPFLALLVVLATDALLRTRDLVITLMAIPATFIQLYNYGFGFLKGFWLIHVRQRPERQALPGFFFKKKQ